MFFEEQSEERPSTAAIIAFAAGIVGVVMVFIGRPGWGLLLEVSAALLGAIGFFMAASPRIGGGMLSILAIVLAVFGIGLSVLGVIGSTIF